METLKIALIPLKCAKFIGNASLCSKIKLARLIQMLQFLFDDVWQINLSSLSLVQKFEKNHDKRQQIMLPYLLYETKLEASSSRAKP